MFIWFGKSLKMSDLNPLKTSSQYFIANAGVILQMTYKVVDTTS